MTIAPAQAATTRPFVVMASGLENPRGLKFGPDGQLYVAEGGLGGTQTATPRDCQQLPPPVGPYSGGFTVRVSGDPVLTGLSFPTAILFDEEGDLFISNKSFGQPTNTAGEVVKVHLGREDDD